MVNPCIRPSMYIPLPNRYIPKSYILNIISRKCDFRASFEADQANDCRTILGLENITHTVKVRYYQKQCFLIYMLNNARWWRRWDLFLALEASLSINSTKISIVEQFNINVWVHRPSNSSLNIFSAMIFSESLSPSLSVYSDDRGPGLFRRMSVSSVGSRRS